MIGKNSPENILKKIVELDVVEFLGVCKILGIKLYYTDVLSESDNQEDEQPRPREFTEIWIDLCDKIKGLNRTRRKNLAKLVNAATSKED